MKTSLGQAMGSRWCPLLAGRGRGVGCWNQNTGKTRPREYPLLCTKEKKIDHMTSILTIWGVDLKIQKKFMFLEKECTSDFAKWSSSSLITAGWGQHRIGTRVVQKQSQSFWVDIYFYEEKCFCGFLLHWAAGTRYFMLRLSKTAFPHLLSSGPVPLLFG